MTTHPTPIDPVDAWIGELRSQVIQGLRPQTVSAVTTAIGAGAVVSTTTMAAAAATGGGAHMTTATIGATTAAHTGLKIAAACLAATLTAGGTLAATGNLPDDAQRFAANAAAHVGIHIPGPAVDATIGLDGEATLSQLISVGTAGQVGVTLGAEGLALTSVDAAAGFTAEVVAETTDSIVVEFRSADRTTSVLVSDLDGSISSSVTGDASAGLDASGDQNEGSVDGSSTIDVGVGLGG